MFLPDDDSPESQANRELMTAMGFSEKELAQMTVKSAMQNAQSAAQNSAVVQKLQAQQQQVQDALTQDISASGDVATGKSLASMQFEQMQKHRAEQNTASFAAHLGTDPDSASYIMNDMADKLRSAQVESINATQEVQDKMAIKFLDDPIGWLGAQITMGDSINAADQAEVKRTKIQNSIRQMQEDTQQAAVTNNALMKTGNDATMQSDLQAAQARINAAADRQKLVNIGQNIAGVMNLQQMNAQQLASLHTATSVLQQEEAFQMQKEHFGIQRQILAFQMQEAEARAEDRKATMADMKIMSDTISTGLSAMGYKQESLQPSTKLLTMYKMGNPLYKKAMEYGMTVASAPKDANGNPYPALSDNVGSLAMDVTELHMPMQATDASIKKLLQEKYSSAQMALPPTIDRKNRAQVAEYIGSLVKADAANMMKNVERGGQDNIYSAPSIRAVLGYSPEAAKIINNSAWGKSVLGPMLAAGGDSEVNSQRIAAATAQAIKSGQLTMKPEDLEGATLFYQLATTGNNINRAYRGKGLPQQVGYNVTVDTGAIGGVKPYNLTDPKQFRAMIDTTLFSKEWAERQAGPLFPAPKF